MNSDLQWLMDAAGGPLGQGLGAATVLALAVWGFTALVRRVPAVLRHALWRGVLAAFWLAPLAVFSANALHLPTLAVTSPVPVSAPAQTITDLSSPPPVQTVIPVPPEAERPSSPREPLIPHPLSLIPHPRPRISLSVILLGLWLGGAALGGLVLLRDLWAVRRLRRTARPVTNSAFSERVAHWAAPLGLRRPVRLAESEAVGVPVLAGLWHPVLLLPPGFAVRMEMAQEAVLVHELAHLRQGDLGTLALARLTGVLLWWHPLVWLTVARLWATAEEVCDDWAVALTATRQGYAEALVQLAEATTASAGSLACVRQGRSLVQRVRRILSETHPPVVRVSGRIRLALAVGAAALLVAAGVLRLTVEPPVSKASVGAGAGVPGTEGRIPERPSVMGTVTDADMGQPLAGARVTLYRMEVGASWPSMIEQFAAVAYDADVTWFAVGPIVTKADGRFTFPAKSPGIYHLEVKAPNYLTARTEEFRLRAGESLTRAVSLRPVPPHLRPGLVTGAVRRVYGPTRLSVRFQGRGQCVDTDWAAAGPPPRPEWWGMSHSPPASTEIPEMGGYDLSTQLRTNAKGRFAFALPPGNCALRFTLPNGRGQEFPDVNIFPGGKVELTVTPGRLPPKPKAVSSPSQPPTGLLQLTILRPDGTPLANTAVLAFPYTVNKAGRIVASDIGFRQVTDARGVVNLSTDPDRQGWWVKAAGFAEGKVPPVKITAGRPARTTMRLPGPTARLVARVRTINGQPVPHAVVAAVRLSVLKGSPGGVSLADTYHDVFWVTYEQLLQWSGRGLIQGSDLPALVRRGHYVALTGARGEGVLPDLEPGTYFTSAAAAGFARESPVRLNIRGRETRREFILRPLARIAGIIRQRDGRPWANVELKVSILGRTGELWWERDQTVQTDAAGRYTLSVADNITRLRFQRNGWVPVDVKPVGLTPGRMKTIDVRLDRGAAVKGTVRPRPGQVLPPGLIVKASQREGQQWVPVAANGTYVLTGLEVGSGWLEVKTGSGRVLAKVDIKIREPRQTLTQDLQVSGRALP